MNKERITVAFMSMHENPDVSQICHFQFVVNIFLLKRIIVTQS